MLDCTGPLNSVINTISTLGTHLSAQLCGTFQTQHVPASQPTNIRVAAHHCCPAVLCCYKSTWPSPYTSPKFWTTPLLAHLIGTMVHCRALMWNLRTDNFPGLHVLLVSLSCPQPCQSQRLLSRPCGLPQHISVLPLIKMLQLTTGTSCPIATLCLIPNSLVMRLLA